MKKYENNTVYFLDIRNTDNGINTQGIVEKLNSAVKEILPEFFNPDGAKSAILKTHIGEPKKKTHMKPELLKPYNEYLKTCGVSTVAYGDSTVAYSGERGYKENPENDISRYLKLAKQNGFTDIPFVVLDRPVSSNGEIQFKDVHVQMENNDDRIRYKKIYPSGGFLNADVIIQNAHLTGHPLAKNALCIKSVSMGLSSYAGKLQLHQNLYPEIDHDTCTLCEKCVQDCPVDALSIENDKVVLNFNRCIGCGQCASVCPVDAITMVSQGIETWNKGVDSIDVRMAEYTIAVLEVFKGKMLHVGHLYNITAGCDCLDQVETPKCKDIGITIGHNPFAVDFASTTIEGMMKKGDEKSYKLDDIIEFAKNRPRYEMYGYVEKKFGIDYKPDIIRIEVK